MANPIQQGLKPNGGAGIKDRSGAAMANPIQQGLKPQDAGITDRLGQQPQWLIQYNKD